MPQTKTPEVNINEALAQAAREKDIDVERWVSALEDAMASAAKKQHRIKAPVRANMDRDTGSFEAYIVKQVVDEVEDPQAEWTLEEAQAEKPDAACFRLRAAIASGELQHAERLFPVLGHPGRYATLPAA